MINSLERYSRRIVPLGWWAKKANENTQSSTLVWRPEQSDSFTHLHEKLKQEFNTANTDPIKLLCVHRDARDALWEAAGTKCAEEDLTKPISEQKHQPLAFLIIPSTDAQEHFYTYYKELYPIKQFFRRLKYLLRCAELVSFFADHRKLLFSFHHMTLEPSLGRKKLPNVFRWEIYTVLIDVFSYDT